MFFKGKYGPMLIAEIGGNHEGDYIYANDLLNLAIESKADAVKFQIYYPNTLVNKKENVERYNHFKKFTFTPDQHIKLAIKCQKAGKRYLASVWDIDALSWIDDYSDCYKIGSGDLTAYPIIEKIVNKEKPIILSTGLSTIDEVCDTIDFIRQLNPLYKNSQMLAVLQCTSMYPIAESEANINVMDNFNEILNVSIGYSDHTEDIEALATAAVKGAQVLEFHFTDSKEGKTFRDHQVSLTKSDVEVLANRIRRIQLILGSNIKKPTSSEINNMHQITFRRALYPSRDIEKGEQLSLENLIALRPNKGVDARKINEIIGKKARCDIKKLQRLNYNMFGDES